MDKMSAALVAMSGGVDSSVAALLAKQQGVDCIGCMMKLFADLDTDEDRGNIGGSPASIDVAIWVADKLGIPFHIYDASEIFDKRVIQRFVHSYQIGETPNPCIECNRYVKFGSLLDRAKELGKELIITGHYARIEADASTGRHLLKKGIDAAKDQSYVLYSLTQEQLKSTRFPLGELTKAQVREIALEHGFPNANRKESQDICFVKNTGYADFIRGYCGLDIPKGPFVDTDGNELGEHMGITHYTIGQRKGLGLSAATPLYVCALCPDSNTVVVGTADKLYASTLIARGINLIAVDKLSDATNVSAKTRYKQQEQAATVWQLDSDALRIEFLKPQRAITKGQAVVLYDGDCVIGGGTISEVAAG